MAGAKRLQRIEQTSRVGQRNVEVFVDPQCEESRIGRSRRRASGLGVASVPAAKFFQPFEDGLSRGLAEFAVAYRGPATAEASQMHEVETVAIAEAPEIVGGFAKRRIAAKREEGLQPEHRVVKVAVPAAIRETAAGKLLTGEELPDQVAGVTEQIRRQPGDLQHFESQTHCTNLALRE